MLEKVILAKSNYLEAYNAGDGEKVLQSLEVLQRVQMDLDNVNKQKVAIDNYNKEMEHRAAVQQQQPQQIQQQPDVKAQSWAEDNDWFGQDSVMTASALAVDAELKQMGYDPNDDQFYTEIDRRMRTEFPHKFQEDQQEEREQPTKQVAQVVAGTSRSPASSNKKVKLSQEDVRLANKWNIPLEVYAAEKLKVDSSDGEYTNINYRGS